MENISNDILGDRTPAGATIDYVIIGIQFILWFPFILSLIVGRNFIMDIYNLDFSNLGLILLSFAFIIIGYSFGITIELVSLWFFRITSQNKVMEFLDKGTTSPQMKFKLMQDNEYIHMYFAGQFSKLRIAKATLFNFTFIVIAGLIYSIRFGILGILPSILLFVLSGITWIILRKYCIRREVQYRKDMIYGANSLK